ncbi:DUF3768 domain-containing protein [Jiella pacifica]|uniref:DUF3768 domain-containing protein n=1 Tax=Jiella pacifica TaxID=2696469 RepID=A0A6N9T1B3_9HYPH|nr:DUF3768 domain-containing protein [Jiella pacifica]NDW05110.1 DUF3768 domain-containing protein [Jiella pacifica]
MSPRTARIAALNDGLRTTFIGGRVLWTQGIAALASEVRADILNRVRTFDAFTGNNDPHGERDFGAFDQAEAGKVFWKIDYYDLAYEGHSPDASDPAVTNRVLTIMLASEY